MCVCTWVVRNSRVNYVIYSIVSTMHRSDKIVWFNISSEGAVSNVLNILYINISLYLTISQCIEVQSTSCSVTAHKRALVSLHIHTLFLSILTTQRIISCYYKSSLSLVTDMSDNVQPLAWRRTLWPFNDIAIIGQGHTQVSCHNFLLQSICCIICITHLWASWV